MQANHRLLVVKNGQSFINAWIAFALGQTWAASTPRASPVPVVFLFAVTEPTVFGSAGGSAAAFPGTPVRPGGPNPSVDGDGGGRVDTGGGCVTVTAGGATDAAPTGAAPTAGAVTGGGRAAAGAVATAGPTGAPVKGSTSGVRGVAPAAAEGETPTPGVAVGSGGNSAPVGAAPTAGAAGGTGVAVAGSAEGIAVGSGGPGGAGVRGSSGVPAVGAEACCNTLQVKHTGNNLFLHSAVMQSKPKSKLIHHDPHITSFA